MQVSRGTVNVMVKSQEESVRAWEAELEDGNRRLCAGHTTLGLHAMRGLQMFQGISTWQDRSSIGETTDS